MSNILIHGSWQDELDKIDSDSVDLIIIDPPYIVTKESWDKDDVVNEKLSKELLRVAKNTASLYVWCGIGEKSQSLIRWFPIFAKDWIFKDLITWKKQRGMGMRKGWLYTREEIMWFVKDNKNFVWNKEYQYGEDGYSESWAKRLGSDKKKRITNVWTDIKEETLSGELGKKGIVKKMKKHFTPKPSLAIERIILSHTAQNDVVLDCFLGSGTTMEVCNKIDRKCIGIEQEEEFYMHCKEYE